MKKRGEDPPGHCLHLLILPLPRILSKSQIWSPRDGLPFERQEESWWIKSDSILLIFNFSLLLPIQTLSFSWHQDKTSTASLNQHGLVNVQLNTLMLLHPEQKYDLSQIINNRDKNLNSVTHQMCGHWPEPQFPQTGTIHSEGVEPLQNYLHLQTKQVVQ